jgi:DNA-directed RNA polymerase specialized sigma24 family protein
MNGCYSRLRKEAVRRNPLVALFLGGADDEAPSADVRARLDSAQRDALDALKLLPARERVAFCMVRLDDAPLADVAAVLGCSVPTASRLVARAEALLARAGWGPRTRRDVVAGEREVAHG